MIDNNIQTNMQERKGERQANRFLSSYFLAAFFGFGALFPLISKFYEEIQLSGAQIGLLMSIGPVVAIIAQPLWGMLTDKYQRPRRILGITSAVTGMIGLTFLLYIYIPFEPYLFFLIMTSTLYFFHSAIVPISDSLALSHVKRVGGDYGSIRLWGAVGFAVAVWITGMVVEAFSIEGIFIIFFLALIVSSLITPRLPGDAEIPKVDLVGGLKQLIKIKPYLLFLVSTFCIFGAINANNFYFAIYYTSIGGSIAGVGFVFLLSAGSEAPFMRIASTVIRKYGLMTVLILSALLAGGRWLLFYFEPSTFWIIVLSIFQGMAVGFYIPTAVQLVRELTPEKIKVTGMSIYASFGNGLGTMAMTMLGGLIYDWFSIAHTYLFYTFATLIGIIVLIYLRLRYGHLLNKEII